MMFSTLGRSGSAGAGTVVGDGWMVVGVTMVVVDAMVVGGATVGDGCWCIVVLGVVGGAVTGEVVTGGVVSWVGVTGAGATWGFFPQSCPRLMHSLISPCNVPWSQALKKSWWMVHQGPEEKLISPISPGPTS